MHVNAITSFFSLLYKAVILAVTLTAGNSPLFIGISNIKLIDYFNFNYFKIENIQCFQKEKKLEPMTPLTQMPRCN